MNDYQIRFLKQSVLGQQVKMSKSDDVVKRCIELADKDMMSGGRFICKKDFKEKSKDCRVKYVLKKLKENSFDYSRIDKQKVCEDLFWKCDDKTTQTVMGIEREYLPFGLAQKLINMTFKYLYIFKNHIGREIDFSKCDCPVDSVVLKKLNREDKWTNMSVEQYESIQKAIDKALKDKKYSTMKKEIGALAFDDNWVNDEEYVCSFFIKRATES